MTELEMASLLGSVAQGKREAQKLARQKTKECAEREIAGLHKTFTKRSPCITLENGIHQMLQNWAHDWTPPEISSILINALHRAYGSPMKLAEEQLSPYSIPYYNPTIHTLNIAPLGLPGDDGKTIERVPPGGMIGVPFTYTQGGQFSTVHSIAPQLLPMPEETKDYELDLTPLSYSEWIMFHAYKVSPCCGKQVLWSNTKQHLICNKCKKTFVFNAGEIS